MYIRAPPPTEIGETQVMQHADIRGYIYQSLVSSPEAYETLQKCGLVDKTGLNIFKYQMTRDMWIAYRDSLESVQEVEAYTWPFSATDWEKFMPIINRHSCSEYAAETLLKYVVSNDRFNPVLHLKFSRHVQTVSTFENIGVIASTMKMYPLNMEIQILGCLVMSELYKFCKEMIPNELGLYSDHLQIASTLLCCKQRTINTIIISLHLVLEVDGKFKNAVQKYLEETTNDIVQMAFDAQDKFNRGVIGTYIFMATSTLLRSWNPLSPPARSPLDIILDYMEHNSDDTRYTVIACIQLYNLSSNKTLTLRLSDRNMSCIFRILNALVMRTSVMSEDAAELFLWDCLDTFVADPETLEIFNKYFTIEFLLASLCYFTSNDNPVLVDHAKDLENNRLSDCCGLTCKFIKLLTSGSNSNNRRRLLDAGGIAVLMNTISYQYRQYHYEENDVVCAVCIDVLCDIVRSVENADNRYLKLSDVEGQTVPVRFLYSIAKNQQIESTLLVFLSETLNRVLLNHSTIFGENQVRIVETILDILYDLSRDPDLMIHTDVAMSMSSLMQFATAVCSGIVVREHHTALPHIVENENRKFVCAIVRKIDFTLLRYACYIEKNKLLSAANSHEMQAYIIKTNSHRNSYVDFKDFFGRMPRLSNTVNEKCLGKW